MKQIILLIFIDLMSSAAAFAQFSSGSVAIGAELGLVASKTKDTNDGTTTEGAKNFGFVFSPGIGYFLSADMEVGGRLQLERNTSKGGDIKYVSSQFGINPYLRKYFNLGEKAAFFGEAGLAYSSGKNKVKMGNTTSSSKDFSDFDLGIRPGFVFMPTSKVGIELTAGFFGYSSTRQYEMDEDNYETHSSFGLSLDSSNLTFGVRYYLQ